MSFWQWWQSEGQLEQEASTDSQLTLGGSSDLLPTDERVDGATVRKRFTKAIQDNGGSKKAQQMATEAESQALFDCTTAELYKRTGGNRRKGRRTLPPAIQEGYLVNESICANHLEGRVGSIGGDTQGEVDGAIASEVDAKTRENRGLGLFRWS